MTACNIAWRCGSTEGLSDRLISAAGGSMRVLRGVRAAGLKLVTGTPGRRRSQRSLTDSIVPLSRAPRSYFALRPRRALALQRHAKAQTRNRRLCGRPSHRGDNTTHEKPKRRMYPGILRCHQRENYRGVDWQGSIRASPPRASKAFTPHLDRRSICLKCNSSPARTAPIVESIDLMIDHERITERVVCRRTATAPRRCSMPTCAEDPEYPPGGIGPAQLV
jgi:hypothetical protein